MSSKNTWIGIDSQVNRMLQKVLFIAKELKVNKPLNKKFVSYIVLDMKNNDPLFNTFTNDNSNEIYGKLRQADYIIYQK